MLGERVGKVRFLRYLMTVVYFTLSTGNRLARLIQVSLWAFLGDAPVFLAFKGSFVLDWNTHPPQITFVQFVQAQDSVHVSSKSSLNQSTPLAPPTRTGVRGFLLCALWTLSAYSVTALTTVLCCPEHSFTCPLYCWQHCMLSIYLSL